MIYSMTGYGSARCERDHHCVEVEIKSINAKHADVSLKLPDSLSAYEVGWHRQVMTRLERGKVAVCIRCISDREEQPVVRVDGPLLKAYETALQAWIPSGHDGLMPWILQRPGVVLQETIVTPQEVEGLSVLVADMLQQALDNCMESRAHEGRALAQQFEACLRVIGEALDQVAQQAPRRIEALRGRLEEAIERYISPMGESSRLEQEMIYHIERLDIQEEMVRLRQHLAYFEEVVQGEAAAGVGKKLGFIAQEMGREINTIGSKANDVAIQRSVVQMKEELEKVKEQLHNVL